VDGAWIVGIGVSTGDHVYQSHLGLSGFLAAGCDFVMRQISTYGLVIVISVSGAPFCPHEQTT
jgi:hypothetical protein